MTRASLARGRLRPVPWARLAALVVAWSLLTQLLASAVGDPGIAVVVFRLAALLLGLGGVVLAAPETDPPRDLLRAAPVPLWATLVVRLAGWLALGTGAVLALARLLDGTAGWAAGDLVRGALPNFALVTAAGFLAASRTSALGGGAAATAAVVGLDLAGRAWSRFPLQLGAVPGGPHWQASRVWMVGLSLVLVVAALALEARTGARSGPPRRHPTARPSPDAQARVRP